VPATGPPPPPPAPPAPGVPGAPAQVASLGYPWVLTVRKTWVSLSKRSNDPNELALTALQIISSPEAKQAGATKRLQELYDSKKHLEVVDVALEWPLYFSLVFPVVDPLSTATELAVDTRNAYFLNLAKSREPLKSCAFQDLELAHPSARSIDVVFGKMVHKVEGNVSLSSFSSSVFPL